MQAPLIEIIWATCRYRVEFGEKFVFLKNMTPSAVPQTSAGFPQACGVSYLWSRKDNEMFF